MLVLETKEQDSEQDQVKLRYLDEWAQAVSVQGGFRRWRAAVAKSLGDVRDILGEMSRRGRQAANGIQPTGLRATTDADH